MEKEKCHTCGKIIEIHVLGNQKIISCGKLRDNDSYSIDWSKLPESMRPDENKCPFDDRPKLFNETGGIFEKQ